MLLSVIFSFRNEEEVLPELIGRLHKTLDPLDIEYELIFVNDDSTDGSLELLKKHRDKDGKIKIINMSRRFGVSQCIMAGLSQCKGDVCVYMDADLQDPPELIPLLIEKWEAGADVVHTIRIKRKGENPIKMWLTRLAYKIINLIATIDILENAGDFKLLSRKVINELVRLEEYDPFLRGLVQWIGFKQAEVFYERDSRFAGQTHFSLFRSLNPAKEFIRGLTSFSSLPLYFALLIGMLVCFAAFIYGILIGIDLIQGAAVPEWTAPLLAVIILGGLNLFFIGIVGIYVGRNFHNVQRRPHYIITSKIGFDDTENNG